MRQILAVAMETFLRLRRDKVFLPAALIGIGLLILAGLASYWGIEDFFKILFDLGSIAWLFTGATVAIFWGNKIISDSRQEGSLEVQLASPISRSSWIIGKFTGLALALILLALALMLGWQAIYTGYGMGWLPLRVVTILSLLSMSWLVMGAVAIFFASIASAAIALFSTIWIFICGLLTGPISQALSSETPEATRKSVEMITGIWNLHMFNLSHFGVGNEFIPTIELINRYGYGLLLIASFISIACFSFSRRDIVG